jgi:hypothetical protein
MPSPLLLDRRFRWGLYATFGILLATGSVWLIADRLKDSANGEFWQGAAANLLMVHGGAAMIVLLLLGALFPLHMARGWRGHLNRVTGGLMIGLNTVLIVTAFGLYYLGSDALRPWISDVHIAAGLVFPIGIIFHIWLGRRRTRKL